MNPLRSLPVPSSASPVLTPEVDSPKGRVPDVNMQVLRRVRAHQPDAFAAVMPRGLRLDGAPAARLSPSARTESLWGAAPATRAAAADVFSSNAILSKYQPTGASARTAGQDGLSPGVDASNTMADTDRSRLRQYKDLFLNAAKQYGLPPAVLAAIASRESRAGAALDSNGLGDNGNGFGLMQVDKRYHTPAGGPYSQGHVNQAAEILKDYLQAVQAKHPDWPAEQQLRGAIVAYNSGVDNVGTISGMDKGTTGDDYSNDVWARALHLADEFGGVGPTPDPIDWKPAVELSSVRNGTAFLERGMKGAPVVELQRLLGLPVEQRDGLLGDKTRDAITAFQQTYSLKDPAGKVGQETLALLEKLSNTAGQGLPAPSFDEIRADPDSWLKPGAQGDSVKALQKSMDMPANLQTGVYDATTRDRVIAFQNANGMTVLPGREGWVGKDTLDMLKRVTGQTPSDLVSAPSLESVRSGGALLRTGMQGDAVKELQNLLGFLPEDQTGVFNVATRDAVARFKTAHGLASETGKEGFVDATALAAIKAEHDNPVPTQAPTLNDVIDVPGTVLRPGMTGDSIKELQKLLDFPVDKRTGVFDDTLRRQVIAFQKANGLKTPPGMEGFVGKDTLTKIRQVLNQGPHGLPVAPTFDQVRYDGAQLKPGMEGAAIQQIQRWFGVPEAKCNGIFDDTFKAQVIAFQKANGLKTPPGLEGVVGGQTLRTLEQVTGQTAWSPAPGVEDVRNNGFVLRNGMQGDSVKALQHLLSLPETGQFTEAMRQAVAQWQTSRGMTPPAGKEGWIDKATLEGIEQNKPPVNNGGKIDLPVLRQGDSPIGDIRASGCGITSCVMVIDGLRGKNMTPETFYNTYGFSLVAGLEAQGVHVTDRGSLHEQLSTEAQAWDVFTSALSKGHPVIFAANGPDFSHSGRGHIMAAVGASVVDGIRTLSFNDPATGTVRTLPFSLLWNASSHPEGNFVLECSA